MLLRWVIEVEDKSGKIMVGASLARGMESIISLRKGLKTFNLSDFPITGPSMAISLRNPLFFSANELK